MGKIVLCTGKRSERPYYLKNVDTKIETIEELCAYIGSDLNLCEDYLHDESLADYMINDLDLEMLGTSLRSLIEKEASTWELIELCLESCSLFNSLEIEQLKEEYDRMLENGEWRHINSKARSYFASGHYGKAGILFNELYDKRKEFELESDFIAQVCHNQGVSLLYGEGYKSAEMWFEREYLITRSPDSMRLYLITLLAADDEKGFNEFVKEKKVSKETADYIKKLYQEAAIPFRVKPPAGTAFSDDSESSDRAFNMLRDELERTNKLELLLHDGKIEEYNKALKRFTNKMKREYRNSFS